MQRTKDLSNERTMRVCFTYWRIEMKYLFLTLVLSGCEVRVVDVPSACTTEQLAMMSKYIEQCEQGYAKGYCFGKAEEAYCRTIKELK
jgi:hypothetical protein